MHLVCVLVSQSLVEKKAVLGQQELFQNAYALIAVSQIILFCVCCVLVLCVCV